MKTEPSIYIHPSFAIIVSTISPVVLQLCRYDINCRFFFVFNTIQSHSLTCINFERKYSVIIVVAEFNHFSFCALVLNENAFTVRVPIHTILSEHEKKFRFANGKIKYRRMFVCRHANFFRTIIII